MIRPVSLIDPGDDAERIKTALERLGKPLEAILLTHGHFDHVGAVKALKEYDPQVPVMIGAADEEFYLIQSEFIGGCFPVFRIDSI